jgi:hypothetical protein
MEIKMKLSFADKFTIEIEDLDITITGQLKQLTKSQKEDINKKFKKELDLVKKMNEAVEKINLLQIKEKINPEDKELLEKMSGAYIEIDDLRSQVAKLEMAEKTSKYRFELSVTSENMEDLIKLCEDYGYSEIFSAITKAVDETKGNDIKA